MTRINIRALLADPAARRELMIRACIALQAREGVTTTREQAAVAYDRVTRTQPASDQPEQED